jgi:hypothetical protein
VFKQARGRTVRRQKVGAWRLKDCGMVKRIAPLGVVSWILLAACGAGCQNVDQSLVNQSLPDAPSVQAATQPENLYKLAKEARSPFKLTATGGPAEMMRPSGFASLDRPVLSAHEGNAIFDKLLSSSSRQQTSGNHSSGSDSLMGRASDAISRVFVTRDDAGKSRVNSVYFLRALTSVAADTASRPYWRRSAGEPFSDFGSTLGNDAGMNLLHEFKPGLQQLVKSHAPRFVSKIVQSVGR